MISQFMWLRLPKLVPYLGLIQLNVRFSWAAASTEIWAGHMALFAMVNPRFLFPDGQLAKDPA